MKRVALLVTGKTEEVLHESLKRIFPEVEFVMLPRREGFTSTALPSPPRLQALGTAPRPTNVERLAATLVAEVEPGRRDAKPPDLVVLVDDLEIVNQAQPERAVEHVREAMKAHIDRHPWPNVASKERATQRVRERCSFHLLAPMVEAYFFAETAALTRAGAIRPSRFDTATDVEQFSVIDPDFTTPANRPPGAPLPPWAIPNRERHPKAYLQFLCDPTGKVPRAYVETDGGRAALRDLAWDAVLAPREQARLVRSLIHDLCDALGEHAIAARFGGTAHELTWPPTRDRVLRNI